MSRTPRRGFTLVEMLVVLGIIAVLAALLTPAVMSAVNAARNAAIGTEVNALAQAIEGYKLKTGDYPPNFRDYGAFIRHVRKVYPKIDGAHLNDVIAAVWGSAYSTSVPPVPPNIAITPVPNIDEGESLVFWLHLVDNDPRYPFKAIVRGFGLDPAYPSPVLADVLNAPTSPERPYPFKEDRFVDGADADVMPSYRALYSKETFYIYIDSRSYEELTNFSTAATTADSKAFAEDRTLGETRPYWSENVASTSASGTVFKPVNPTTFQIIGAGQDGLFGVDPATPAVKFFPGGGGYSTDDRDNMTNFAAGRRLEDHIP